MQLALHTCRRRGEAAAELLQGLPEPLESAAWLMAHPHSLYHLVAGPNGGSLGREAGSAPWRRCLHSGALPGSCKVVGTLVTRGCRWFASPQRPGRDVFSFSCAKLFGKERGGGETIPIQNLPMSLPSRGPHRVQSLSIFPPRPKPAAPFKSFSSAFHLIVCFPLNRPRMSLSNCVNSRPSSA